MTPRQVPLPTVLNTLTLGGQVHPYFPDEAEVEDEQLMVAQESVDIVLALARSHTRGGGFTETTCAEDIAAVVTSAALRLYANPTGLRRQELGQWSEVPGTWSGWLLPEILALNSWRRRTA